MEKLQDKSEFSYSHTVNVSSLKSYLGQNYSKPAETLIALEQKPLTFCTPLQCLKSILMYNKETRGL